MLELEQLPYQETITIKSIAEHLPKYSPEEIEYCCLKLHEAEYIGAYLIDFDNNPLQRIVQIYDITFLGHEFLNNIHSDNVWNTVKNVSSKIGANSISALTQIATNVVTELIKQTILPQL